MFALYNVTFPPTDAIAAMYVAASILSGMTLKVPPDNFSTPSISIFELPKPVILAPHLIKHLPRSIISGSLAALLITVFPSAKTAAIIKFSVAPTETVS